MVRTNSRALQEHPRLLDVVTAGARSRLIPYVKFCDQSFVVSRFHRYLADKLESVAAGKTKRLIISVPPRHGKSRLTSVELVSWMMGQNPALKVIMASYASSLAAFHSKEVRDRLTTHSGFAHLFPRTQVRRDNRSGADWRTTAGGNVIAAGVGTGITGRGADLIIVDDPVKDHEEAHSATTRENIWNWYLSTLMTRLSPGGSIIVIMTRWHVDDLVGRLLDPIRAAAIREAGGGDQDWDVVNLPGLAEDEADPLGRSIGEPLFPERFPADMLRGIMASLGSYIASALYRGKPVPKGGNYVSRDAFVIVPKSSVPNDIRRGRYWDLATSEKARADFTAGARGFIDSLGNLWIEEITSGQWAWPHARGTIATIATREKILLGVEAQSAFKTAADNLREVLPSDVYMRTFTVDRDKFTRALPWIALAGKRKVFLVEGPWVNGFIQQAEQFPSGAHDDEVDAVSGLYTMLKQASGFVFA